MTRRPWFGVILALFFMSGASGLIYEIIWVRLLTQIFGTSTFAVSALLTSFMAGLGLGSFLAGRTLSLRRSPLAVFGLLEWGVGLYALFLPTLLPMAERVFLGATSGLGLGSYGESLLKLVLSLLLLLPPTALMGASLPLLAQHSVDRLGHLGVRVGSLYALNTLGATFGCLAAGFFAIPEWGVRGTTLFAAALNFSVGAAALAISARRPAAVPMTDAPSPTCEPPNGTHPAYSRAALGWAFVSFAFSGCAALGLEVIWTRLITLAFKGFTYSFSTMLTVFLAGIGLGSLLFGRRADRSPDPLRLLGLLDVAIGVAALATAPLFIYALDAAYLLGWMLGGGWANETTAKFIVCSAILIGPTLLFGATFPVVSRLATTHVSRLRTTVGNLYALNVAGSILGAFVTGYVLIPLLGSHRSLQVLSGGLIVLGAILVAASPRPALAVKRLTALAGASFGVAGLWLVPDLSYAIHERWLLKGEQIGFYREGATATVMVAEGRNSKRILVSGSSASNSSYYGLSVNRIQGCLPFLFEKMPRNVLAICFGTGITFGTLSQFEVDKVDGVDISPEVFAAAPRFASDNYDVLHSRRAKLHADDGRNFLLKSRERYDAITMEPMPPALAGVVNFYTREFYELCRAHLEPGGIVSQWVPLYYLGPEDVKVLYRTFAESFPYALVFFYNYDTFMVGSDRPLDLSGERFSKRLTSAALARDLGTLGLDSPERMLGTFLMGRENMLRFAGAAPRLTDDFPIVEFTAPKMADESMTPINYLAVTSFAESARGRLTAGASAEFGRALDRLFRENQVRWRMARREPAE